MTKQELIAALFVQKNGSYYGLADVDPWDEARELVKRLCAVGRDKSEGIRLNPRS